MRKFLNISVIAAVAILPMAANAATGDIVSVSDPATYTGNANVTASTAPKYALAVEAATDTTNVATASYVKGAYNAAMKAINKVSETASSAVQSVDAGTANGTISVDGGADVTVYDDTALAGRVTANETKIGNTPLTTTATTLTGAIEEVKSNALTSSSLTDYAKKSGVTQTITNSTITGTVPTVIAWGAETTSTAAVTASITGATYAEPSNP